MLNFPHIAECYSNFVFPPKKENAILRFLYFPGNFRAEKLLHSVSNSAFTTGAGLIKSDKTERIRNSDRPDVKAFVITEVLTLRLCSWV